MKPHKHAELIKAWADGAEIEEQHLEKNWHPFTDGHWMESDSWNYRIKPQPKPDVVRWCVGTTYLGCPEPWTRIAGERNPNLKLVFDGETGELKSAEVL